MKILIKIFIALVFILGSYFIGYYQANEKFTIQLAVAHDQLLESQLKTKVLEDSINSINRLLIFNCIKHVDTIKTNIIIPLQK
jgi:hypothetical protein